MAQYDTTNVETFMEEIDGIPGFDLARIWAACAFRPVDPLRHDLGRVVDQFYDLPIWEQQAVLFKMVGKITEAARSAAMSRAAAARKTDPI